MSSPDEGGGAKRSRIGLVSGLVAGAIAVLTIIGVLLIPMLTSRTGPAVPATTAPMSKGSTQPSTARPVPTPSPLNANLDSRVLLVYQTLGADVMRGIPAAFKAARLKEPTVTSWKKSKSLSGPLVATAKVGRPGDPVSKMRAFAGLVNGAPRNSVDIAVMTFDYRDVTADTNILDLFDIYTDTMTSLESANPDVIFLYATAPVSTSNSWRQVDRSSVKGLTDVSQPVWQDNIARERFNTLVRQEYSATGRLFDVASVQATLSADRVSAKEHESQWYFVMNPNLSKDGSRLNDAGSLRVARSMMELVAAAAKA